MFVLMVFFCLLFAGNGVFGAATEAVEAPNQAAVSEAYLVAEEDNTLLVTCARFDGKQYDFTLKYFPIPFTPQFLFWKMNMDTLQYSTEGPCIDVTDNLGFYLPCVSFMGIKHGFSLEYYANPPDPDGMYWIMNTDSLSGGFDPFVFTTQNIEVINEMEDDLTFGNYRTPYCEKVLNCPAWIKPDEKGLIAVTSSAKWGCAVVDTDVYTDIRLDGKSIANMHISKACSCWGTWSIHKDWTAEGYDLEIEKGGVLGYDWTVTVKPY